MKIDFFKNLHDKEFERREHLANRANTIVTGLSLLGSIFIFLATNYSPTSKLLDLIIGFLLTICFAFLCISIINLVRSYQVPVLVDIASSKDWLDYWNSLSKNTYPAVENNFLTAEDEFNDYLISQYVETTEKNVVSNTKKGTLLVKSNNALLSTLLILLITSVAFYYNNIFLK